MGTKDINRLSYMWWDSRYSKHLFLVTAERISLDPHRFADRGSKRQQIKRQRRVPSVCEEPEGDHWWSLPRRTGFCVPVRFYHKLIWSSAEDLISSVGTCVSRSRAACGSVIHASALSLGIKRGIRSWMGRMEELAAVVRMQ